MPCTELSTWRLPIEHRQSAHPEDLSAAKEKGPSSLGDIVYSKDLERPGSDPFLNALRATAEEPRLTSALRRAKDLHRTAAQSTRPERDARLLAKMFHEGDGFSAIAALHALAGVADPAVDRLLVDIVDEGEPPFASHAAWALAERPASPSAFRALRALEVGGGFAAMIAELTLLAWANRDAAPAAASVDLSRQDRGTGIVVVQPFLYARLDRSGSQIGVGDSGGIASLLRSLGAVLPDVEDIDEVITITRRCDAVSSSETIAPSHRIERIGIGPDGPMSWREAWSHRTQIEDQFVAIGQALAGRRVVWHLRMADVGTLAASNAARRLGHQVVFTAAADPHIVIDALQDSGRLDRANFAFEDAAAQYWFRARLVERLSTEADHLVLFPRPTIERELVELVGLDPIALRSRSTVVAEGVDVAEVERARARSLQAGRSDVACRIVDSMPIERQGLPWLLTVGRLNPSKGPQRIVEAVASDPMLADHVNIVIVGGDLEDPSPDEQSTIERIRLAAIDADPGLVTLAGHLPPSAVADLMADMVAHGGLYVCASDKEEFGLAIVEALAAGATVVAPERGGPRTYIANGETGVLCDTLSRDALRGAILDARVMEDVPGRAERARAMVRADLSVERMAEQLGGVYRDLLPASRPVVRLGRLGTGDAARLRT